jgi:hypothetical protein
MKADRMGTWTEQVRARMGWMSPAQRKASAAPGELRLTCSGCKHFYLKEIPNRDGGVGNCSPYCGHPDAAGRMGHATRESALCDRWEMKP